MPVSVDICISAGKPWLARGCEVESLPFDKLCGVLGRPARARAKVTTYTEKLLYSSFSAYSGVVGLDKHSCKNLFYTRPGTARSRQQVKRLDMGKNAKSGGIPLGLDLSG